MGMINPKSIYNYRFPTIFPSELLSSLCQRRNNNHIDIQEFSNKQKLCMKKKVLILGLDGVGKTDLFNRLVAYDKQSPKIDFASQPQPTVGYNVETIKVHCKHLYHRRSHKITLWDCGGQPSLRPLWSYHFSNTSLLLWLINVHDRSRLDTNLHLLSQVLTNPLLYRVPVLIILYENLFGTKDENDNQNLLTNLEVAFRFLATLSTSRASTFKWQVININLNGNSNDDDLKKIRQSFKELMEL